MYISIDIGGTYIRIAKSNHLDSVNFTYDLILKEKLSHNFQVDFDMLINCFKNYARYKVKRDKYRKLEY